MLLHVEFYHAVLHIKLAPSGSEHSDFHTFPHLGRTTLWTEPEEGDGKLDKNVTDSHCLHLKSNSFLWITTSHYNAYLWLVFRVLNALFLTIVSSFIVAFWGEELLNYSLHHTGRPAPALVIFSSFSADSDVTPELTITELGYDYRRRNFYFTLFSKHLLNSTRHWRQCEDTKMTETSSVIGSGKNRGEKPIMQYNLEYIGMGDTGFGSSVYKADTYKPFFWNMLISCQNIFRK